MALITSISGIRGTIGGSPRQGLSPEDVVRFTRGYARWAEEQGLEVASRPIVIGRDGRLSGEMIARLVSGVLMACGWDVLDLGLSTTPTTELAVVHEKAAGGIIITASHNPREWNALKLLNRHGEFLSQEDGERVLALADTLPGDVEYPGVDRLGGCRQDDSYIDRHIEMVLEHPLVDPEAIHEANLKVVVDCVHSTGGLIVPPLLRALGVAEVETLYGEPTGRFPHNPEPLPENLSELRNEVRERKAHLGIAVDPDVDRLAFISEDGEPFGEEYTLVAVADYVLSRRPGSVVSNLSSTRALQDIAERYGRSYYASAVGEVNVVDKMKAVDAVIGGEGNGGIIVPEMHYGRDAVIGLALFLSHLAHSGLTASQLRRSYPDYKLIKTKVELDPETNLDKLLEAIHHRYRQYQVDTTDGIKIDFDQDWVHLRKSNTEPIIRIYAESGSETTAENLAEKMMYDFRELLHQIR